MKKIVKTDNKLCVKLFAMLLVCSTVLAGLPSAVLADHQDEPVDIDFLSANLPDYVTVTNGTVEDGILKLTESGASIKITKMIKPNTNYTFSFMMKNSLEDSLAMKKANNVFHFKTYSDRLMDQLHHNNSGKTYAEAALNYFVKGGSFSYVVSRDHTFGSERAELDDIKFRKVSINFSTPSQSKDDLYSYVTLELSCDKADNELAIDDISLIEETGKKANRIFNGDFEAIDASGDWPVLTNWYYNKAGSATAESEEQCYEIVEEPLTGNHYLKIKNNSADGDQYHSIWSYDSFLLKRDTNFPNNGQRYKVSLKHLVPSNSNSANNLSKKPRIYLGTELNEEKNLIPLGTVNADHLFPPSADKWETYTIYIDGSNYLTSGKTYYNGSFRFGHWTHEFYLDDIFAGIDESTIDFNETLDLHHVNESRYFDIDWVNTSNKKGTENMISTEKSIPVSSLSELKTENNIKKVTPRVHYIPTKNDAGGYDVHNITLVAAVYGKDAKGNRILNNVKLASGTTTADGKTIDVKIDDLQVPADGDYTVETMAINMDNMKPLVNKTILTETGIETVA